MSPNTVRKLGAVFAGTRRPFPPSWCGPLPIIRAPPRRPVEPSERCSGRRRRAIPATATTPGESKVPSKPPPQSPPASSHPIPGWPRKPGRRSGFRWGRSHQQSYHQPAMGGEPAIGGGGQHAGGTEAADARDDAQSRINCHDAVIQRRVRDEALIRARANSIFLRMPKRCIAAAANGPVRP